ncbi:hypothetical protein [Marinobacter sp. AN1]|uniref:hypothetical protein n=1 Tax=Marinobacter sp. AN1 TaxID=2886046 RepID=UPI002231EEF9|nr:hypothetical protein [Marinobacter sp. AN1]UZD65700.1 hypothetical protein LJ360_19375 [Marinobacter sp. AN1]
MDNKQDYITLSAEDLRTFQNVGIEKEDIANIIHEMVLYLTGPSRAAVTKRAVGSPPKKRARYEGAGEANPDARSHALACLRQELFSLIKV